MSRVAVIGAGVAGLQAARALQARAGADVVVFERAPDVGGVWRENYADFGAQVVRDQYHFPELADGVSSMDWYPKGEQLHDHCRDFVRAFGLQPCLRLSREVTRLQPLGGGRWRVSSRASTGSEASEALPQEEDEDDYDYVVVAVGNFSTRFVPQIPGSESFTGVQLHSSELIDASVLDGRRVAVVGAGKSAVDCLVLASSRAAAATLIARNPGWLLPRRFCGVPLRFLSSTRFFADLLLPPHHDAGPVRRTLSCLLLPLQRLLWLTLALLLWLHFRLPRALRPRFDLRWQLWHGHSVSICDPAVVGAALRSPGTTCIRGEITCFREGVAVVDDTLNERQLELPVDVVVFATGYREAWSHLFDAETLRALDPDGQGPRLYKQVLPAVDVPGLAFVGRAISTSDVVTSFVQAEWLAAAVAKRVAVPSPCARAQVEAQHRAWRQQFLPVLPSTLIATPRLHSYLGELVTDLQSRTKKRRRRCRCCPSMACLRGWPGYFRPHRATDYSVLALPFSQS